MSGNPIVPQSGSVVDHGLLMENFGKCREACENDVENISKDVRDMEHHGEAWRIQNILSDPRKSNENVRKFTCNLGELRKATKNYGHSGAPSRT